MTIADTMSTVRERFDAFCRLRKAAVPGSQFARLHAAFSQAEHVYGAMPHWTGDTVLEHCMGVLEEYQRFRPDDDSVVACLLHHVLEAGWTPEQVERASNASVRSIVSGVHLLSHVTMRNKRMSLQNLRLMFVRVSDDMRAVLLLLCDRNRLLSRLAQFPPDRRRQIARDTLQLFAPVAARLGIYSLKHEMETKAFPVAYPTDALRIAEQLQALKHRHGTFLPDAALALERALRERGVSVRVEAREKHAYSVFRKMRSKSITHAGDLYDLFALRVVVDAEPACYQVLGVLHQLGHPVANRFKDFVAFPKPNGYRSLHTTLMRLPGVPEGVFVEVQIRTEEMHREAKLGIAAHWSYKEGGQAEHALRRAQLQQALAEQSPEDDHIFVLTPTGEVIELPEGATPLDFAFHVHTMLGLSFRAARVNGAIVPIATVLENGDIVEILRHSEPKPSPQWVTMLKTSSARTRLRHFLSMRDRPFVVQQGREAMNRELQRYGLQTLDPALTLLRSYDGEHLPIADREELLVKVGQGSQTAASVLRHLDAIASVFVRLKEEKQPSTQPLQPELRQVRMEGGIPMPVRYARCCKPDEAPFTALSGVIGRDGSVRVHRHTCKMLRAVNPERRIGVEWEGDEG